MAKETEEGRAKNKPRESMEPMGRMARMVWVVQD
jgi:hypothetical protein